MGGNANGNITTSEMYSIERGNVTNLNNKEPSFWYGKVALISPSDYFYSSSSCHLLYTGNHYNMSICKDSNWLFIYKDEMLLNPDSRYSHCVLYISGGGSIYSDANVAAGIQNFIFRPSFYLKTTVKVINNGNDGSIYKPYILTI